MSRLKTRLLPGICDRCGKKTLVRWRRTNDCEQSGEYSCVTCVQVDIKDYVQDSLIVKANPAFSG